MFLHFLGLPGLTAMTFSKELQFALRQGYVDARGEHRGSEQQYPLGTGGFRVESPVRHTSLDLHNKVLIYTTI